MRRPVAEEGKVGYLKKLALFIATFIAIWLVPPFVEGFARGATGAESIAGLTPFTEFLSGTIGGLILLAAGAWFISRNTPWWERD